MQNNTLVTQPFYLQLIEYKKVNHIFHEEKFHFNEMLRCARVGDLEKINYYKTFGTSVRHILHNVLDYEKGLEFGFTDISFNEHGWLVDHVFAEEEIISFRIKEDKACCNHLTIGVGPNGTWTYGWWYNYGAGAGGVAGLCVFRKQFKSRHECIVHGLNLFISMFKEALQKDDISNYNYYYCSKVLKVITEKYNSEIAGCAVTAKGQCLLFA